MDAVNDARREMAIVMIDEEDESRETRSAQRQALADFAAETRLTLADAISEDRAALEATIDELDESFNAFLIDQLAKIHDDVTTELDSFNANLEELYNFAELPQYGTEEVLKIVPYVEYQHRNFLHKFSHWLEDQLAGLNAQVENMITSTDAEVAGLSDAADQQM
jgi:hypothetical protein